MNIRLFFCVAIAAMFPGFISAQPLPDVPPGTRSAKALEGGELKFWPDRPDTAEVLTATFLGGTGNEWLAGAGIQPDGTIVVVGNVIGPDFNLGVPAKVIGKDGPPPAAAQRAVVKDGKGNPKTAEDGSPKLEPPSWRDEGATGFIAHLSSDFKKIASVTRFPWKSVALTSCVVGADGSIYVAGRAGTTLANAGAIKNLSVSPDATRKSGACDRTFIAKLNPAGDALLWGFETQGLSDAPRLSLLPNGNVTFGAQELKTFDPAGKLVSSVVIPGGVRETTSVNPLDGTIAKGGEHHWGTGREPWRCPTVNILNPDGTTKYELYNWAGPYVGLDNSRLVSDSAVRLLTHDKDGNILFVAWSDGGNSVMGLEATDVRSGVKYPGLGLNAAGANATSFAYIVKLDPKDYQVVGWTFWCSKFGGKANGIGISALSQAVDGSFCVAGGSAWGLTQTNNRISPGEPGGNYVAVFNSSLSGVRFCSTVPGTAVAEVDNDDNGWAISSGTLKGKPVAIFAGSAVADGDPYGLRMPTPTVNALQSKFGGGWSDGYLLVVDLSKTAPAAQTPEAQPAKRLNAASRGASSKKDPSLIPADGAAFYFSPTFPRYVTVDIEARAASGKFWPSFLYGRPVSGTLTSTAGVLTGEVKVLADNWLQSSGDQSRRILGELVKPGEKEQTPIAFTLSTIGPAQAREVVSKGKDGKENKRTVDISEVTGTLEVGTKKLPVKGEGTVSFQKPRDGGVNGVGINVFLTLKGSDLGLKTLAAEEVDLRIGFRGTSETGPPPKDPKGKK